MYHSFEITYYIINEQEIQKARLSFLNFLDLNLGSQKNTADFWIKSFELPFDNIVFSGIFQA